MSGVRRIAANEIVTPQGVVTLGVVEITDGRVTSIVPLDGEQPLTEWHTGTITVRDDGNYELATISNNK